jgi:hypothetical protein
MVGTSHLQLDLHIHVTPSLELHIGRERVRSAPPRDISLYGATHLAWYLKAAIYMKFR